MSLHGAERRGNTRAWNALVVLLACYAGPSAADRAGNSTSIADTTLATVGHDRVIGLQSFRTGWNDVSPPARGDSLTPDAARRFLDLLIGREALTEEALREAPAPTAADSAQWAGIRDRLAMRIALDSALSVLRRDRQSRGEPPLDAEAMGVALRESTVTRLAVQYDDPLVERLARAFAALPRPSADSSIASRMRADGPLPAIASADTGRVVARSTIGDYQVADLLAAWAKLPGLYRPHIETPEQVRELVDNGLFDRALRREIERHHYANDPRVVTALRRQREYQAVQSYLAREVYAHIAMDSVTLRRRYDRDPAAWRLPTRLRIVSLILPGRPEATRMAVTLRDGAAAESLVARGRRGGVDYTAEISAHSDSVLFARAMRAGTGAVLGPDSTEAGWQVVRVLMTLPARQRAFTEVRESVAQVWTAEEGPRRIEELLARLRKQARVVVNQPVLARLVREGI